MIYINMKWAVPMNRANVKIQNGRRRAIPKKFVSVKTQKLFKFTITFLTLWRCAGDFFKVLLKFKMATMNQLYIFLWPKYSKIEVINNSHFIITLPAIWKVAFLYICDREKL